VHDPRDSQDGLWQNPSEIIMGKRTTFYLSSEFQEALESIIVERGGLSQAIRFLIKFYIDNRKN